MNKKYGDIKKHNDEIRVVDDELKDLKKDYDIYKDKVRDHE